MGEWLVRRRLLQGSLQAATKITVEEPLVLLRVSEPALKMFF